METKEMELTTVELGSLARGAVIERFDEAMKRVLENIVDPDMVANSVREINMKIRFAPSKDRRSAAIDIAVEPKLAKKNTVGTLIHIGKRGNQVEAFENNPDQLTFPVEKPTVLPSR